MDNLCAGALLGRPGKGNGCVQEGIEGGLSRIEDRLTK